ncbi:ParA family protein [Helicovermis profundi]|uniref:Sporulation initiation inhibitor protein Soj n=1 Tax=Helicovermis profundi TaxID=3065157 RepID=A0AAU9E6Q1_9FIRM|nr:AAA family ATPase [Clostridia bacterium S502]
MGKSIAIFNQKGGVGKTTTNVNLSACLARLGYKILVIDNDPQGNSTSGFGIDKNTIERGLYEALLFECEPYESIVHTSIENLDLIPANLNLAGAEIEMIDVDRREHRLKKIVDELHHDYDYIFVDCPPSLGLLTINSLVAVDSVIIPIQCEYYALEGVSSLMSTLELIKKSLNKTLAIEGILMTMYDGRTNLAVQVVDEVRNYFKASVFNCIIPKNVRLAEAPSFGKPIIDYDTKSKGAKAYRALAKEFVKRNGVI